MLLTGVFGLLYLSGNKSNSPTVLEAWCNEQVSLVLFYAFLSTEKEKKISDKVLSSVTILTCVLGIVLYAFVH